MGQLIQFEQSNFVNCNNWITIIYMHRMELEYERACAEMAKSQSEWGVNPLTLPNSNN